MKQVVIKAWNCLAKKEVTLFSEVIFCKPCILVKIFSQTSVMLVHVILALVGEFFHKIASASFLAVNRRPAFKSQ